VKWEMDKFLKRLIKLIAGLLLYRVLLDLILIEYLSYKWSYIGFYNDFNINKSIISYTTIVLFALFINFYKKLFSHFFYGIIFLIFYVPFGTIYSVMNKSHFFYFLATISFLILCFFIINIKINKFSNLSTRDNQVNKFLRVFILIISAYTFLIMTYLNVGNVNFLNAFNLLEVYSIRDNAKYNLGMNYLFNWQSKVINPFMIAITIKNKQYKMATIFILFQLWLFMLTGHKMVLFNTIIVFLIIISKKAYMKRDLITYFLFYINVLLLTSFVEIQIKGSSYIVDLFFRRVFYIPPLISYYYYDFFDSTSFRYWKDSLFGRIFNVGKSEDLLPSFIIGKVYFNNEETNAVTGFLGSEYVNAGTLGVLLATIIVILILKIVDYYSFKVDSDIVLITFISPIYTLWNSAILTSLLTGGILLSIFLLSQTSERKVGHAK
jgi:hypothetical protein